mmetsp:Transcript_40581/g.100264  ORF Transcript_40581/g.100264 Transcript_40581/m.100264 type:complete len:202 (-) Transcript_40581:405-1010(-)
MRAARRVVVGLVAPAFRVRIEQSARGLTRPRSGLGPRPLAVRVEIAQLPRAVRRVAPRPGEAPRLLSGRHAAVAPEATRHLLKVGGVVRPAHLDRIVQTRRLVARARVRIVVERDASPACGDEGVHEDLGQVGDDAGDGDQTGLAELGGHRCEDGHRHGECLLGGHDDDCAELFVGEAEEGTAAPVEDEEEGVDREGQRED